MESWPSLQPFARTVWLPQSGVSLFYYDTGQAPGPAPDPMLLIHGLGDEADTWRHLLPKLSSGRRVVAPDLPGFGRSDKPDRLYSVTFFQEILIELLDVLKLPRAAVLGHSLGAVIAHSLALRERSRVDRLVLIGGSLVYPSQKIDPATLLYLIPGLGEWMYNRLRKEPQAAFNTLQPYYNSPLDQLPEADRQFCYQRVNERVWDDGQRRAFLSSLRSLARWLPGEQRGLASRLAVLDLPTLGIWGQLDRINPPSNGEALVQSQPGARLAIIPGAGHNVQQENPGAVYRTIMENF